MGGGGWGRGRGDFREEEGQTQQRGGGGKGALQPPPGSFLEAVGVGQLGVVVCSAGLIWKPEGWGRALEKTMGLCV